MLGGCGPDDAAGHPQTPSVVDVLDGGETASVDFLGRLHHSAVFPSCGCSL